MFNNTIPQRIRNEKFTHSAKLSTCLNLFFVKTIDPFEVFKQSTFQSRITINLSAKHKSIIVRKVYSNLWCEIQLGSICIT